MMANKVPQKGDRWGTLELATGKSGNSGTGDGRKLAGPRLANTGARADGSLAGMRPADWDAGLGIADWDAGLGIAGLGIANWDAGFGIASLGIADWDAGWRLKKTSWRADLTLADWETGWRLTGRWLANKGAGAGRKLADWELADSETDLRLANWLEANRLRG